MLRLLKLVEKHMFPKAHQRLPSNATCAVSTGNGASTQSKRGLELRDFQTEYSLDAGRTVQQSFPIAKSLNRISAVYIIH
jgi:hypothetical protein